MSRLRNVVLLGIFMLGFGMGSGWAQSVSQAAPGPWIQPQPYDLVMLPEVTLPAQIGPVGGEKFLQKLLSATPLDLLDSLAPSGVTYFNDADGKLDSLEPGLEQANHIRSQLDSLDLHNFSLDSIDFDQVVQQQLTRLEPIEGLPPQPALQMPQALSAQDLPGVTVIDVDRVKESGQLLAQATDYFQGHEDKLQEAQSLMSRLKKKYRSVANSNDLSTAIKRHSLQDQPFNQRITPGINFQLLHGNPMSIDLAPNLMYRFNALFSAGLAGNFRASLGFDSKASNSIVQNVYGGSILVKHTLFRDFFLYSEGVWLSSQSPPSTTEVSTRSWHPGWLVGLGKRLHFSERVKGQVIFTYDVLHDDNSPAPRAWNIRFGIQTERLFRGHKEIKDFKN